MHKVLKKEIMKRSQIRKFFLKKGILESQVAYNKQRNYCARLLLKERRTIFEDNQMFCKTVKHMFSKKYFIREMMMMINCNSSASQACIDVLA